MADFVFRSWSRLLFVKQHTLTIIIADKDSLYSLGFLISRKLEVGWVGGYTERGVT